MEWVNVSYGLPPKNDIYNIRQGNGDETKAYFYHDGMGWAEFYGQERSHWWDIETKESLNDVTHWQSK